jgi:hypothetical protein
MYTALSVADGISNRTIFQISSENKEKREGKLLYICRLEGKCLLAGKLLEYTKRIFDKFWLEKWVA